MSEKMREILFRGKRIDNDEWAYGSFCMDALEQKNSLCGVDGFIRLYDFATGKMQMHEVDRETVGQYIGLTDKNGNKIFEGDILRTWSDYHKNYYYQGFVRYGEFNCSCCDGVYGWYLEGGDIRQIDFCEVCGNIHDNPELRKDGTNV